MENHNDFNEELKHIGPTLSKMDKRNVFEAPEGYFEKLPWAIQEKLKAGPVQPSVWHRVLRPAILAPSLAIASCFAIMIYFNTTRNISIEPLTADDITESSYMYDIDPALMAEMVDHALPDNSNEQSDEIDYLLNNGFDISQIVTP